MVASDQPTDTGRPIAEVRDLRICLMRLHAARQVLLELRRLSIAGLIKAVPAGAQGTSLNSYLKALARQVLTPEAFGTNQAELNRILSLYDLGGSEGTRAYRNGLPGCRAGRPGGGAGQPCRAH
jgi:hypothetical protein